VRQLLAAGTLAIVLVGLALLQYRWLGDVSAAERERMRASLQSRASDVAQAFDGELTRIFIAFHVDADRLDADAAGTIADAYARWQAAAAHAAFVRAVDVIDPADLDRLRRFDPASRVLAPAAWPPAVRAWLTRLTSVAPKLPNAPSPLLLADAIDGSIPALVIAVPKIEKSTDGGTLHVIANPASIARTIVVELDADALRDQIVAPLVTRYFGAASDSVVTIVTRDDPAHVVYASDPGRPLTDRTADVTASLFDLRMEDLNHVVATGPTADGRGKLAITIVRRANAPGGRPFLSTGNVAYAGGWRLLARYRSDSLDALVAASRRRNFALVIAILLLLGGSVSLTMVSAERARRMARQQMEFVASVSHELRTPLAVIRSAGENLADGVVSEPVQIRRYGRVVESEGRRLSDMVDRVMRFAGMASGAKARPTASVDVSAVLHDAIAASEPDAAERSIRITLQPDGALPAVAGDADALRSAVQNVIGNAIKYSSSGGAIVVSPHREPGRVRIRVEDSGIGIDAADLPHVFKPFYRGRRAVDAQIRGSGIGLSLVRTIVQEHGGDVRIESEPGSGTRVTIDLPERG
jgi:signal transduction histidine kinase